MGKHLRRILKPNSAVQYVVLLLFSFAAAFVGHYALAVAELLITIALFVVFLLYRKYRRKKIDSLIGDAYSEVVGVSDAKVPFPMAVIRLEDGGIVHVNDAFVSLTGYHDVFNEHNIDEFLNEFKTDWLISGKAEYPYDVTIGKKRFRLYGSVLRSDDSVSVKLGMLYFADLTELYHVHDEYIRSRPVVSIVLVDNYEELTRNMTEAAISAMDAQLNNTIMNWAQQYHGLLRRMEKNRFLLIFEKRDLKKAIESKFSILEEINSVTSTAGVEATISIGLGVDGATFEEGYEFAALSIEMALSRGGDQAVVKDRLNFNFFGGRTKESDQRSKVRSRVTANTMMELIGQSSQIFIMGHRNADLDSVGAALGIACLCRKKNKPAHIILDMKSNAAKQMLDQIVAVPEYADTFISGDDALVMCDSRSTLVVVDTNRPDQVEYKPLLESITRICVVDHHLRAADYINPVAVNFHEPNASSASELVTELLEYAVEQKDVLPIEAKALMAGIYLDTKNFNVRTGERTFEAAAYLRQLGVDTIAIKMLFQSDYNSTIARHKIVQTAKKYEHGCAIAVYEGTATRPLAAQAADEILNIAGVTSSFVLFQSGDSVIISARSIGGANVQVILEQLGGGGNAATAGAQISGKSLSVVSGELQMAIDKYYEK